MENILLKIMASNRKVFKRRQVFSVGLEINNLAPKSRAGRHRAAAIEEEDEEEMKAEVSQMTYRMEDQHI